MNQFLRKWFNSFREPETNIVWFFVLPAFAIMAAINIIFISGAALIVSLVIILLIFAAVFLPSLSLSKANYELAIEKGKVNDILTALVDAVIIYDEQFKIIAFNKAAEILFGLKKDEILNHAIQPSAANNLKFRLLAQVIFPSLAPVMIKKSAENEPGQVFDLKIKEPEQKELRVYFNRIIDEKKNLIGFVKVIHDRSREKSVAESKTEFLTIAAHEFRTPLTAIKWAFEALASNSDPGVKDTAGIGLKASGNLLEIVEHLLSAAKIEEGRFGYQFEKVDLTSLIEKVLEKYREPALRHNIKIYFQKPDALEPIEADAEKISIVIGNLISNAIKYNIENGQIAVKAEKISNQPFIEVSVKDTGIGIPPAEQDKIFSKFFRSSNALKFQTEGIGLGLFIVRNIVKRHGGNIWFESEEKRGTTFHFTLPTNPKLIPPKEAAYDE